MIQLKSLLYEVGEGTVAPFNYNIHTRRSEKKVGVGLKVDTHEKWSYQIDAYTEDDSGKRIPQDIILQLYKFDHRQKPEGTCILMFEFYSNDESRKYSRVNSRTYMYRIMSTIMNILRKEINDDEELGILAYVPIDDRSSKAKENILPGTPNQRDRLYSAYIRKMFPGATREEYGKYDIVFWRLKR